MCQCLYHSCRRRVPRAHSLVCCSPARCRGSLQINLQGKPHNRHFTNGETEAPRTRGTFVRALAARKRGNRVLLISQSHFLKQQPQLPLNSMDSSQAEEGWGQASASPLRLTEERFFHFPSTLTRSCSGLGPKDTGDLQRSRWLGPVHTSHFPGSLREAASAAGAAC